MYTAGNLKKKVICGADGEAEIWIKMEKNFSKEVINFLSDEVFKQ